MNQRFFWLLVLFVIGDLAYSCWQHSHVALDGDLAPIVVPRADYQPVLDDPFGLSILADGHKHAGANRYFVHASMRTWFLHVPIALQAFFDPIDSVYASAALLKILIQLLLLGLFAALISGKSWREADFWLVAAIMTPLFQTFGYNSWMGLIANSITYFCFYGMPLAMLVLFFLPFYRKRKWQESFSRWTLLLFPLTIILPLSGPLVAPVVILAIGLWGIYELNGLIFQGKKLSFSLWEYILLACIGLMSLYAFYLGTFNAENAVESPVLSEMYSRLPLGLFQLFTQKLGLGLLLIWLVVNAVLLQKIENKTAKKHFFVMLRWMGLFACLYVLLLPLGGYRSYRPLIVRADTFLPVTICLFYLVGSSSFLLIKEKAWVWKKVYRISIGVLLLLYMIADEPTASHNACERQALETLSTAQESPFQLPDDCTIIGWEIVRDTSASEMNSLLLEHWGITEKRILYWQGEK